MVIKSALTVDEQCQLFEAVDTNKASKNQKSMKNANNEYRYGHFMRLNLSETERHIRAYPIHDSLFRKMIVIINKYNKLKFGGRSKEEIHRLKQRGVLNYNLLNLKFENVRQRYVNSLYYKAPHGMISKHCDKKKEIIMLYSLGCTANFFVKGKSMDNGLVFGFESGDCLIFDASKNADIVHGIDSIQPDTCPPYLHRYPFLIDRRICVQTRCQF